MRGAVSTYASSYLNISYVILSDWYDKLCLLVFSSVSSLDCKFTIFLLFEILLVCHLHDFFTVCQFAVLSVLLFLSYLTL